MIQLLKESSPMWHPAHTVLQVMSRYSEARASHWGRQGVTRNTLVCQPIAGDRRGAGGQSITLLKKVESLGLQGCHLLLQRPVLNTLS